MKYLNAVLVGSLIVLCGRGSADVDREYPSADAWVKVRSGMCENMNLKFAESGTLFRKGGKIYALTSEHGIFHANGRFCHTVENMSQGIVGAKLVAVDWAFGVALLELVVDKLKYDVGSFDELFDLDELRANEGLVIAGSPRRASEIRADPNGTVYLPKAFWRLIANIPYMIEVLGSNGEYGMSGGPVYRKTNKGQAKGLVGMLSHQYLEPVEGGEPVPKERTETTPNHNINHLLIVPASSIRNWLLTYFSSPEKYVPGFVRDPDLQWFHKDIVFSSGLAFTPVALPKAPKKQDTSIETNDPGGPKGNGGEGVGGEGVGGAPKEGPAIHILVEHDEREATRVTHWPYSERTGLLRSMKLMTSPLESKGVLKRFVTKERNRFVAVPFASLGNFFSLLQLKELTVTGLPTEKFGQKIESTAKDDLEKIGKNLTATSRELIPKTQSPEANALLEEISLIGELLVTDWELVTVTDTKRLRPSVEDIGSTWKALLKENAHEASQLISLLVQAEEILKQKVEG